MKRGVKTVTEKVWRNVSVPSVVEKVRANATSA